MKKLFFALIFVVITLLDQLTKLLTVSYVKGTDGFILIPNIIKITYIENQGAAFGILYGMRYLIIALTLAAIFFILYIIISNRVENGLLNCSAAFIAAGATGNLIDRLRLGFVVDMIDIYKIKFAVFNIADCFITIGAILVVIYAVASAKSNKKNV